MAIEGLGDSGVTGGLAGAVSGERADRIVLGVGAGLRAVEDVIGREVDERSADLAAGTGERGRAVTIDRESRVTLRFRLIDRGIGAGVDDDARPYRNDCPLHLIRVPEIKLITLDEFGGKTQGP